MLDGFSACVFLETTWLTALSITTCKSYCKRLSTLGLTIAGCLLAFGEGIYSQSIRTSRDANPKIVFGEFPPDFELPRLRFDTNAEGKPVGVIDDSDTVRLSSFRGKKPVCMIMSSYT